MTSLFEKYFKQNVIINDEIDNRCTICASTDLINKGVVVCTNCGSELGAEIQTGIETGYSANDDTSRCNNVHNPLLEQSNYKTSIAGDSYLKRLNQWSYLPYTEKMLASAFKEIDQIVNNNGLNYNIAHTTQLLYKEAVFFQWSDQCIEKKRKVGLLEACLYYACAKHNMIHSHKEIAQFCNTTESRVIKGCKAYFQLMSESDRAQELLGTYSTQIYLTRFCDSLAMSKTQKMYTQAMLNKIIELDILNENPTSIAGACIYLSSVIYNYKLSKSLIALQCGISEVTLAKIYKKLVKVLDKIL